jgi:hypothetical protein
MKTARRPPARHIAATGVLATAAVLAAGCGNSATHSERDQGIPPGLLREMRPIGRGPRFQPPVRGPVIGACRRSLGPRFGVHVEVFAANHVVIIPAGVGIGMRLATAPGRGAARCYGAIVTLQPTGVVLVRAGTTATIGDLFRSWGQPLSATRIASFRGGGVRAFRDGRPSSRPARSIMLARHGEIVIEIGPHVPPHRAFTFPPGI